MIPLGPFTLYQPFARGAMGAVWRGVHTASAVPVAVKVLTSEGARTDTMRQALQDEVRAVAALDHPHVVWVHDTGVVPETTARASGDVLAAGSPYLVMELADGGTVKDQLRTLTWATLAPLLDQALAGLAHAHSRGVVHRDLKPANLLLHGPERTLKLTDFGIAHVMDPEDEPGGASAGISSPVGTPGYMAPEQFDARWRDHGPPTDLYALACLVWLVVNGARPFAGKGWIAQARARRVGRLGRWSPRWAVPEELEPWLRHCLRPDPADRFQTAAEARRVLGLSGAPGRTGSAHRDLRLLGAGLGLFGLRNLPVVGRGAEQDRLWAALLAAVAQGRPRAVVIRGPAGCGKSRLAEWVCVRAREEGRAAAFRAVHGEMPGPGEGLVGLVARALRCLGAPREEVEERVGTRITDPGEAAAVTELLCPSAPDAEGHVAFASASERYAVAWRALQAAAGGAAVVLWLDDVVLGSDAVAFAAWLLEHGASPALLVLTAPDEALPERPEAAAALQVLQDHPAAEGLELGPLDAPSSRAMVQELLHLEPGLAQEVAARTAGNPLFAVQLVGDWVERGKLRVGPHGFQRAGAAALPDSLQQVWASRIGGVLHARSPAERLGLWVAAVLGVQIDDGEWAEACADVGAAASAELVSVLVSHRLARREEAGWSFVHAMLREAVLGEVARDGRTQELHAACARMLASRTSPLDGWRRGRHLLGAGAWDAGVDVLLRSGQDLIRHDSHAAEQALRDADLTLGERGIALVDPRRQEALRRRALCAHLLGRYDQAESLCADLQGSGEAESRMVAHRVLGEQVRMRGDFDAAREQWRAGLAEAEREGDREWIGLFCRGFTVAAAQQGDLEQARSWGLRALEAYHGSGAAQIFDALFALAFVAHMAGDTEERQRWARAAEDNAVARGVRSGLGQVRNLQAEAAREAGDLDGAEARYRDALALLRAAGSAEEHVARINLGLVLVQRGEIAAARSELTTALAAAERMGRTLWQATVRLGLLACSADDGDWPTHLAAFRAAQATRYVDPDLAHLATLAARRARAAGHADRASEAYRIAVAQWEGLGRADEAAAVRAEAEGPS